VATGEGFDCEEVDFFVLAIVEQNYIINDVLNKHLNEGEI
jgi:hypothetical protein